MSTLTIASLDDFQKQFQARVEIEKEGKIEVTNSDFYKLQALRFVIVGGNGAFNALYGWSLGYNVLSCVLLAIVMFSGDWALSLLHQITTSTKQAYAGAGLVTKTGLIFLSLVAGTSFMLGIKHAQEIKNSNIPLIEENIKILNAKYEETSSTKARQAREAEQEKLQQEKARVGDFSSANAFPAYLAKAFDWSYEKVAMALNITWIAVLLFTGMSLSAQLGMVWCPARERAISNDLTHRAKEQARREKAHAKALAARQKVVREMHALIAESSQLQEVEGQEPVGKPEPIQERAPLTIIEVAESLPANCDIAWEKPKPKRASSLKRAPRKQLDPRTKRPPYEAVKQMVVNGQVKPSQAAFVRLGMGARVASDYRQQMIDDGILRVRNQRGDCEVVTA